ncbi:hypothetical protein PCASD_11178 [Puccinia coronata f. sp. avenae]|uniref:Adenine DNA glycosylase n=1 Tax=Puccinia coronata f. sp. avenae TaxID=200324 RepID=A0A2N5TA64_9BASI|nr:hypothetical protein PCASD_11178 [Puccinia coronata f. sp. avenae]
MNKRARRSTSRKVVYTEEHDHSSGSDDGRVRKRKLATHTHVVKKSRKKTNQPRPSDGSSSLTDLDDAPSSSLAVHSPARAFESCPEGDDSSTLARRIITAPGRPHPEAYHTAHIRPPERLASLRESLLAWFDQVKENRSMPWRKAVTDISRWTEQQRGQRAYEVWVSEIMLQQTQVETVKSYYLRWMDRFPTIFDLAKADVEQVNECWQGLGYYSRASRLLSGAKKVVKMFSGILPEDPSLMEKEVDGIGPYSAGAIASIAYAKPVPMVDGNVHRVLSRITALYAPQAAKSTTKFLWATAALLVPQDRPGDFNQALMELGATVCKPREASCHSCPLVQWCRAYQEKQVLDTLNGERNLATKNGLLKRQAKDDEEADIEEACGVCQPLEPHHVSPPPPSTSNAHVLIYPMAKERKKQALREVAVSLVIWKERSAVDEDPPDSFEQAWASNGQSKTLLIKRPEKGLLAGLWEFPSVDLATSNDSTVDSRRKMSEKLLKKTIEGYSDFVQEGKGAQVWREPISEIEHIFSHIRMTYKSTVVLILSPSPPPLLNPSSCSSATTTLSDAVSGQSVWYPSAHILNANIGNPHKKIWNSWLHLVS